MAGEIEFKPLGTVAKVRSGYAFKSEDMGTTGLPIIKIKNIAPPRVEITDCERVPESVISSIPNVERFELSEGDTLIAMTGATVGKVGRFPRVHERHFLNQRVGKVYLSDADKADYRYLYYILSQDVYVRQMFGVADGSAQANISGAQIESLDIPLPPLSEQKAIAHILGSLDDKIELNRRMNATLEAMARALFQSWFVDFDPVRAKLDGRPPAGLDQATAALFPAHFQDSPHGPIPHGWEVGTLGEITDVQGGFAFKSSDFQTNGDFPVIKIKNIRDDRTIDVDDVDYLAKEIAEKSKDFRLEDGDLLMAMTGATVGKFGLMANKKTQALLNQRVARFQPKSRQKLPWFVYCSLLFDDVLNQIIGRAEGSAQPNISANGIKAAKLKLPPKSLVDVFNQITNPLFHRLIQNNLETRNLATLRNTLLPKLLSGELRIQKGDL